MLSLVHVLEWRAAVNPEAIALTDHQGAQLTYAGLATARALTADGFYRTGDVGTMDADGYLTIVDRLNDVVITGRDRLVS